MSANSTSSELEKFNFSGGLPTSVDLAPSYFPCLLVLLWRIFKDRTMVLLRPSIFILCRFGTLGLRAWMSKNSYGQNELIAELVMVSIGFLFLVEPVVTCWKFHVESAVTEEERPRWVHLSTNALRIGIIAAIATAIAGSSEIGDALNDPSQMDDVNLLRRASMIISLIVVILAVLATILTHIQFKLATRGTVWLLCAEACLFVVAVYKLAQFESNDPSSPARSRVAFWILQMTFELFAFVLILSISIPQWFPGGKKEVSEKYGDV
nr:hypothetical protein L204_02518 [Cryptococcus depauperatus CBS 7855]